MNHTIFPDTEKINFSKKLNIKFGIDPTSDKLHLGHLVPLLLLKKLWREGHNISIILGTFTAQLGDPSGKDTMRPILNSEDVEKNAKSIMEQIHRFFDNYKEKTGSLVTIFRNHVWFEDMGSMGMLKLLSKFTTTQLLSRDSFQKRISEKNPIGMHELTVPVLQGYDSVHVKADVEIGGNDQMFNFGITRDVQRLSGQTPEVCILMPIINGTDGRKMSKSFDNCIFFNDTPIDVFGKTMSISDELMEEWWSIFMSDKIKFEEIRKNNHPLQVKKELAWNITNIIWPSENSEITREAQEHFENVIQNRNKPKEFITLSSDNLVNIIIEVRKCSISEAKRLISQGGIKVNDNKIIDESFGLKAGDIVKVGKLDFVKII